MISFLITLGLSFLGIIALSYFVFWGLGILALVHLYISQRSWRTLIFQFLGTVAVVSIATGLLLQLLGIV